jgi:hypothetical protein
VTSPASPSTPPAAAVSGMTNNRWQHVNFATVGGTFLLAVNGFDFHRTYDGSSWAANTPAITGVSSATLSFVAVYASRLFFIEKNTLDCWYLPVDSIGGAAIKFSLRGVMSKGGALQSIGTWSIQSGDGLGEKIVFISTNGQAAVYQGTDPSSASAWSRVGLYEISTPVGPNGLYKIGGELEVLTSNGIVPLSVAVQKDPSQLSLAAVTREINPEWKTVLAANKGQNWLAVKWPEQDRAYVAPSGSYTNISGTDTLDNPPFNYTVNLNSTAFSTYRNWDMQSAIAFNGEVYFGSAKGKIYKAETSGSDDGAYYVFRYLTWPSDCGAPSKTKTYLQMRTTCTYSVPFYFQKTLATNYSAVWQVPPNAVIDVITGGRWDQGGKWDTGNRWDQLSVRKTDVRWSSIGKTGYNGAVMIQSTFSNLTAPDVELILNEVTYTDGAVVT